MKVRYNGTDSLDVHIQKLVEEKKAMTICPELLGGFMTPRAPAEIVGGTGEDVLNGTAKVVESSGKDVSDMYIKGAHEALNIAKEVNASLIILKEYSPSCGSASIYNGSFENRKIAGNGVTSALLKREGFKVISEENMLDIFEHEDASYI
jgi:uncharacterized protein YbbK (DUF523 family)